MCKINGVTFRAPPCSFQLYFFVTCFAELGENKLWLTCYRKEFKFVHLYCFNPVKLCMYYILQY